MNDSAAGFLFRGFLFGFIFRGFTLGVFSVLLGFQFHSLTLPLLIFLTQPIFDPQLAESFLKRCEQDGFAGGNAAGKRV